MMEYKGYIGNVNFDYESKFFMEKLYIHIPVLDLTEMKECFRQLVINHFKDTGLLAEKIARNLLSWGSIAVLILITRSG